MPSNIGTAKVRLFSATKPQWYVDVEARLDTGATRTSIDEGLADFLRLKESGEVATRSASGRGMRELARLKMEYKNYEYTLDVCLKNREGMNYPMILGRDVLE
jgi:hypothetical protein